MIQLLKIYLGDPTYGRINPIYVQTVEPELERKNHGKTAIQTSLSFHGHGRWKLEKMTLYSHMPQKNEVGTCTLG